MNAVQQIREELMLEWYFSKGVIAFERSTFGGMLERAELFSVSRLYHPEMRPVYDEDGQVVGYERGITARPTAEQREPSGYLPDSETLTRYAHISMLLMRVERQSRQAAQVLEILHGDLGQRWAGNVPYGRLGALFHLTSKGKQLLDEARNAKGAVELGDIARMEVLVAVQRVQPKRERTQCFAYCLEQARALEKHAREVWQSVRPELVGAA